MWPRGDATQKYQIYTRWIGTNVLLVIDIAAGSSFSDWYLRYLQASTSAATISNGINSSKPEWVALQYRRVYALTIRICCLNQNVSHESDASRSSDCVIKSISRAASSAALFLLIDCWDFHISAMKAGVLASSMFLSCLYLINRGNRMLRPLLVSVKLRAAVETGLIVILRIVAV